MYSSLEHPRGEEGIAARAQASAAASCSCLDEACASAQTRLEEGDRRRRARARARAGAGARAAATVGGGRQGGVGGAAAGGWRRLREAVQHQRALVLIAHLGARDARRSDNAAVVQVGACGPGLPPAPRQFVPPPHVSLSQGAANSIVQATVPCSAESASQSVAAASTTTRNLLQTLECDEVEFGRGRAGEGERAQRRTWVRARRGRGRCLVTSSKQGGNPPRCSWTRRAATTTTSSASMNEQMTVVDDDER